MVGALSVRLYLPYMISITDYKIESSKFLKKTFFFIFFLDFFETKSFFFHKLVNIFTLTIQEFYAFKNFLK